jgi:hypothetical protein
MARIVHHGLEILYLSITVFQEACALLHHGNLILAVKNEQRIKARAWPQRMGGNWIVREVFLSVGSGQAG